MSPPALPQNSCNAQDWQSQGALTAEMRRSEDTEDATRSLKLVTHCQQQNGVDEQTIA